MGRGADEERRERRESSESHGVRAAEGAFVQMWASVGECHSDRSGQDSGGNERQAAVDIGKVLEVVDGR